MEQRIFWTLKKNLSMFNINFEYQTSPHSLLLFRRWNLHTNRWAGITWSTRINSIQMFARNTSVSRYIFLYEAVFWNT